MAKEHDPFAEFIVSSPVIDQFNKWSEPKATQSDDGYRQVGHLAVRVAKEVLNGKNLEEVNTFR